MLLFCAYLKNQYVVFECEIDSSREWYDSSLLAATKELAIIGDAFGCFIYQRVTDFSFIAPCLPHMIGFATIRLHQSEGRTKWVGAVLGT